MGLKPAEPVYEDTLPPDGLAIPPNPNGYIKPKTQYMTPYQPARGVTRHVRPVRYSCGHLSHYGFEGHDKCYECYVESYRKQGATT